MKKLLPLFFILIYHNTIGQNNKAFEWNFRPSQINQALLQNNITGIAKDNAGFLWITTQFGLYRFDGQNTQLYATANHPFIKSNRFSYIIQQGQKLITLNEKASYAIEDGQLKLITLKNNTIEITNKGNYDTINLKHLPSNFVKERLGSSNLLFFDKDTLLFTHQQFYSIKNKLKIQHQLKLDASSQFFNIQGQVCWINNQGIQILSYQNNKLIASRYFRMSGQNKYIQHTSSYVWIQNDKKLIKIAFPIKKIEQIIDLAPFKISDVTSCFEDHTTFYFGTTSQGIFEGIKSKGKNIRFQRHPNHENYIYSYAFDSTNKTYYTVNSEGLFKYNTTNQSILNLYASNLNPYHLTLYKDDLYFVNKFNEIIQFNLKKQVVNSIFQATSEVKKIDKINDSLLVITESNGIYEMMLPSKKVRKVFQARARKIITTSLYEKGNYWIGFEDGMIWFNSTSSKSTPILPKAYVRSLLRLNKNKLAIGTYGMGSFIFEKGEIFPLKNDPMGISSAVVALSKDNANHLWVLCNKGAFVYNPSNRQYQFDQFYATNDQILAEEINGGQLPSSFPIDQLVFPSSNGLFVTSTTQFLQKTTDPKIQIESVFIDNKPFNFISNQTIQAKHNELTIQLAFPHFVSNYNFNLLYKLEGIHQDWKPLPLNRKIILNQLGAGHYQLLLKTNLNKPAIPIYTFTVEKYWYNTFTFYLLLGIILFTLFYFLLSIRTKYLRAKQIELEKIIHDNTKQLKEQIKVISNSEKEINKLYKHSNKLYSILMHDLKSPLQFLSSYAIDQLKLTKSDKKSDPDALQTIASTSADLYKFINEFLYWLQRQNKNQEVQLDKVDLIAILKDIVQLYEPISSIQNNRILYFPKPASIFVLTDPDLLKIIFRNLIDNANKYTTNGVIKLSSESSATQNIATIVIQDSGKGLPDYVLDLMAQENNQQSYAPSINANHKMGIQITKEFISQINGTLEVTTSKENGTAFKIHLPLYFEKDITIEKDGTN